MVKRVSEWDYDRLIYFAEKYGTPIYVTDLEQVSQNYNILNNKFKDFTVKYAAKANTDKAVLKTLKRNNCKIECASLQEAKRVLFASYNLSDIQTTLVNPSERTAIEASKMANKNKNFTVTLGSRDAIQRFANNNFKGNVLLRVKKDKYENDEINKNGARQKFGIPKENIEEIIERNKNILDIDGLHTHIGGSILTKEDIEEYITMVSNLFNIVKSLDYNINKIDLGGGLGIPYKEEDSELNIDKLKNNLLETIPNNCNSEIIIEPGRYIVGDSSILLTRANTIRNYDNNRFVGVDAGMTELIRPAMFGSYHPIRNISQQENNKIKQTIAGPTCSGADIFCHDREIEKIDNEDIIAIGNVGAYGNVLSNHFHSYPKIKNIVFEGNKEAVSKEEENIHDIIGREKEVKWL